MKKIVLLLSVSIIGVMAHSAIAQESQEAGVVKPIPVVEGNNDSQIPEDKAQNKVFEAAKDFTAGMDPMSERHFTVLFSNYNLIEVVKTVQDDIGLAVAACGKENAEMQEPMNARFADWKAAIAPIINDAEANVGNMIVAQSYAEPREIKKFFKFVDKTREEREDGVEKVPVTSKEACNFLLKSMDKTQPNMVSLLKQTLVSLPLVMQEQDDAAAREAEADAQENAQQDKAAE